MAAAFVSNHYHLLIRVEDAEQLSSFMTLFNSKVAREVGRLTGWTEKVWSRRFQAIVVSEEEGAQVARLLYVLSHGCKEGLVARVAQWPGLHAAPALLSGEAIEGIWHDRTGEYLARLRGEKINPDDFIETETLTFQPLPCWRHLSAEQHRVRVAALVEQIETEAAAQRRRTGREPLGVEAVLRQDPTGRPESVKKSPAPRFHAFTKKAQLDLYATYSSFVAAFREAAAALLQGDRKARFPIGSFPPHLPFVREAPPPPGALPQPV